MTMLRVLCLTALVAIAAPLAPADELTELNVLPEAIDGTPPAEMMHAYLMEKSHAALDRRLAEYEKIKTPEEIAAYQQRMRRFFVDQLGGFPERTPLDARTVGREARDGYRIEKIIFQSQPRHFVTAILYLPEADPPYPGVLVPCGHSANGKARDLYQRAPILLAKNGLAALCYDPIDQGERHQLLGPDGKPLVTQSTQGHTLAGVGAILLGRNTATYRIWDGMRAIDYLQSRPEIDPQRIGCTGISGGGTLTSYLMALDDRIAAAAPGCYLTSFRRLLETKGPQDAEQTIYAQIAFGMDHADYVMMRASKPTLMMTATDDYFDITGAWNSFRQAKRLYTRLGFAERVDLFETPGGHGFPAPMRVAAARWMRRWLLEIDDAVTESDFPVATDEEVQCTPRGEVMLLDGARSVYDLNVEQEERLAGLRKKFWDETDTAAALAKVRQISGIRPVEELPELEWEEVGTLARDGYQVHRLILAPEPGIRLPALAFVPGTPAPAADLYLHAEGKAADAEPGGPIEELVRRGHLVLAVDLRGIGETHPTGKHSYSGYLPPDWRESTMAYLLGTSYLAMRAEEILQCARFLAGYQPSASPGAMGGLSALAPADNKGGQAAHATPRPVHLLSIGRTGPAALHAAALEPNLFQSVTLRNSLVSWSQVVRTPLSQNQFVNLVHGALRTYDLPDLAGTLTPEKLTITAPLNAAEQPLGE
jgi:cephalosporin-C deacetylase-like acetyl esterase